MSFRILSAACLAALLLAAPVYGEPVYGEPVYGEPVQGEPALAEQAKPTAPKKAAQKAPAEVALAAAQAALDRKDYTVAATILENFLFEHPGHAEALFQLAYCYGLQGRTADAIDLYRQTLEAYPKLLPARINLGLLLLESNQPEAAAAEFTRALEINPDYARAHHNLGAALEQAGKKDEAVEHYRRAAALDPALVEPRRALLALLLEKGDLPGASAALDKLLRLQPEDASLLRLRADLLLRQEKRTEALAAYEDYLQKKPDAAETRLRVGRLYREEGKNDDALRHFQAAGSEGVKERADTLLALERFDDAIPLYQEALAREPESGEPADAGLHAGLGFALLKTRRYQEAAVHLAEAVRLNPRDPEPYNHLAAAFTLAGDLAAAIGVLDARARVAEETPATLFLRAWNYDKLSQCGPAIEYYEKFLAVNRDTASDQYFQATGRLRLLKNVCRERRR